MAVFEYKITYGLTFATVDTYTATNVQEVQFNYGRQKPLDQYNASTASVTLRYPNGYVSPEALWVTGTCVRISGRLGTGAFSTLWSGRIADVNVDYGIPYQSNVGNADYVTLSCESYFASFGRVQGLNYAMPAGILGVQTTRAMNETGLDISSNSQFGYFQAFPATTVSSTWGDWINRVVLTMNGRLLDAGGITPVNAFYKVPGTFGGFSDTTNDAENHPYNHIAFSSLADNYYTQITVTPESYSPATVQTGSIPYRTYSVNTLNNSTSQATDYATYLLSTYDTQALRILAVTISLNNQISDWPKYGQGYLGAQVTVLFRGTTYRCVVEGGNWSGTPDQSTATFYLSAQDLNDYLTLNDSVYGKLDFNKLGY
jgi:hypothetical protein